MADGAGEKTQQKQTLGKSEVIRGFRRVQIILAEGRKYHGKYVLLFFVGEKKTKVGFIVSRKFKKAVERNRLRRLMREVYRTNKAVFAQGSWLFYGKHVVPLPNFVELKSDILKLAQKIKGNDE